MPKRKAKKSIVENYDQAAAALKVSRETLRAIRDAGSPGFIPGNRIDLGAVRKWLVDNPDFAKLAPDAKGTLPEQKLEQEIRRLRNYNDAKEAKVVLRSSVESSFHATAAGVERILDTFVNEGPPLIVGLDLAGCRVKLKQLQDKLTMEFRGMSKHWNV